MSNAKPIGGFKKEEFGWFKRWWKDKDHLVVLGFNHATGMYFTLVKRQVRDILNRPELAVTRLSGPLVRARAAVSILGIATKPKLRYEGSLRVSKTAISYRHFVFAELFEAPDGSEPKGYYIEFDESELSKFFGSYEVPVADYIIRHAGLRRELEDVTYKVSNG